MKERCVWNGKSTPLRAVSTNGGDVVAAALSRTVWGGEECVVENRIYDC